MVFIELVSIPPAPEPSPGLTQEQLKSSEKVPASDLISSPEQSPVPISEFATSSYCIDDLTATSNI